MINSTKILTPILLIIFVCNNLHAQDWNRHGKVTHEIGVSIGVPFFSTDYGERYETQSSGAGNTGFGISAIHYFTLADYRYRWNQRHSFFRDHFRFRTELSYYQAKLEHFGQYVDDSQTSDQADRLRAHTGEAKTINFGTQAEYHFVNITDFGSRRNPKLRFSPYLSIGIMATYYNPSIETTYGDGDWESNYDLLYQKWANPAYVSTDAGFTGTLTSSLGSRIKLGEYSDVFLEGKWHYYFNDWIDGLNATGPDVNGTDPNNKYNDWSLFVNFGFIYYLN
ncbi:glutamate dehydrogenase [Urechidicola sp. KH5]